MIKVKALSLGYYGNFRRRPGVVFEIKDMSEMGKWMQVLDEPKEVIEIVEEIKEEVKPKPRSRAKIVKEN